MRWHHLLTGIFLFLSLLTSFWLLGEVGAFGFEDLKAADQKESSLKPENAKVDSVHAQKEKELQEREGILKDTLNTYEKAIGELKVKMKDKEKEWASKLEDKDHEIKNKLTAKDAEIKNYKAQLETMKDSRIESFKNIYEKMESKKAAKILEEMDIDLSTQIVTSLRQERAADILGKMSSDKARLITEKAAGKRKPASEKKVSSTEEKEVNALKTIE